MAGPMRSAPAIVRSSTGISLVALAVGLLAQLLFVDAAFGLNVPIATGALLLAGQAWNLSRERARDTRLPSVCPLSTR